MILVLWMEVTQGRVTGRESRPFLDMRVTARGVLEGLPSCRVSNTKEAREGVTRLCECSREGAPSLFCLGLGFLGPGTLSIKAQETCLVAEWVRIHMPMQGTQV